MSNSSEPAYLSIQQLSKRTGFSVTQLRRLAKSGRIPCHQPGGKGGKLFFPPDAIEGVGKPVEFHEASPTGKKLSGRAPKWMQASESQSESK